MNTYLMSAKFSKNKWTICKRKVSKNNFCVDPNIRNIARRKGKRRLAEIYQEYGGTWGLELTKSVSDEGELAIGYAEYLANLSINNREKEHFIYDDPAVLSKKSLMAELNLRGEKVSGYKKLLIWEASKYILAAFIASLNFLYTLVLTCFDNSKIKNAHNTIFAAHGELSTRTKHLLKIIPNKKSKQTFLIVLGRPKISLNKLSRSLWKETLTNSNIKLVRPINFRSAIHAISNTKAWSLEGIKHIRNFPLSVNLLKQVSILYRGYLGLTSATWWQQLNIDTKYVIYGHTGTADTTELELAQQKNGTKTIHLFHGLSSGLNLTGYSTFARLKTACDASSHERLGGYGKCVAPRAPIPKIKRGEKGWLILSNIIHPMNDSYRKNGVDEELKLVKLIVNAANDIGVTHQEIMYKPHPVIYNMSTNIRSEVFSKIETLNICIWDKKAMLSHAKNFQYVFTTPSTIAIDLLKMGILPIVINTQDTIEQLSIIEMPIQVDSCKTLKKIIKKLSTSKEYNESFKSTWDSVMPCTAASLNELISYKV